MNLYQFTLETHPRDGLSSYEQRELLLAPNDQTAAQFAQAFARHWQPHARYDSDLDVYSAPEGFPQWTLMQCKPITQLSVPVAGQGHPARIALIPWQDSFANMLALASNLLSAVCDPSMAECSLKWIVTDHLNLGERAITNAFKAIVELRGSVTIDSAPAAGASETTQ